MKTENGFTLIEVMVYLGLFAILFGGVILAAYNIVESSDRNQTKAMVQEEGNFLMAKINWVISGAQSITSPAIGAACLAPACPLSVIKWDTSIGNPVVVSLTGTDMTLTRGSNPPAVLNNNNVQIINLSFTHTNASGDGIDPESLKTQFTVSARMATGLNITEIFSSTDYLRK